MAYDYLNKTTDDMFKFLSQHPITTAIEGVLPYYENILRLPKFKAQRYYFQNKLFDWNPAFACGYFRNRKAELSDHKQEFMELWFTNQTKQLNKYK